MTPQEIFDMALKGIREQGAPGVDAGGACVYMSPDGKACGVGYIMTAQERIWAMTEDDSGGQGEAIGDLIRAVEEMKEPTLRPFFVDNLALLVEIQHAHDGAFLQARDRGKDFMHAFEAEMRAVAPRFELEYK